MADTLTMTEDQASIDVATQTIWGVVGADGTRRAGSGFKVLPPTSPGQYSISFDKDFASLPAIVGSQMLFGSIPEDTRDGVVFPSVDGGSFVALTGDSNGNPISRTFGFIAIGPVTAE